MSLITRLLPLWAALAAVAGYVYSAEIAHFKSILIPVIALIMFSMGLTLRLKEFSEAAQQPFPLALGVSLQFLMMPLLAWLLSLSLNLPTELMTGMILVGSAPGGTASNVLAYLSGGRVALSITMTTVSTLLSLLITPLMTGFYLDEVVEVDRMAMLISIAHMILLPVCGGMLVRYAFTNQVKKLTSLLPVCAAIGISLAISIVVALNADALASVSFAVILAVLLHNLTGLFAGYILSRISRLDISTSRTIAIEVGTQNSGMSAALAVQHFSALAGIPSALFSVFQNILGTLLACYWKKRTPIKNPIDP